MFMKLPFEVTHISKDGTSVTFPAGAVINIGKYPEIARKLEKYNKMQQSPEDKMVRTSGLKRKSEDAG